MRTPASRARRAGTRGHDRFRGGGDTMTDTDEQVARLLAQLAHRADRHGPHDRVPLVRRRARRAAAVRALVLAGGLAALVALVVAVRTDALPLLRGDRPEPAPGAVAGCVPGCRVAAGRHAHRHAAAQGARGSRRRRRPRARARAGSGGEGCVALRPGAPAGAAPDHQRRDPEQHRGRRCMPGGRPTGTVDDEFPMEVPFKKAGAHAVTYETTACPPIGTVRRTITVRAR
jgi:hypothetical protein